MVRLIVTAAFCVAKHVAKVKRSVGVWGCMGEPDGSCREVAVDNVFRANLQARQNLVDKTYR